MGRLRVTNKKNKNIWQQIEKLCKRNPLVVVLFIGLIVFLIWSYITPTAPLHNLWLIRLSSAYTQILTSAEIIPPELYIKPSGTITFAYKAYDQYQALITSGISSKWTINPSETDAGNISLNGGVFTASNNLGNHFKAVKLTVYVYGSPSIQIEVFADVHITNDLSPIIDGPVTPYNFQFQDIVLAWHPKPGTYPTQYYVKYRFNGSSPVTYTMNPPKKQSLLIESDTIETTVNEGTWEWAVTAKINNVSYTSPYRTINKEVATDFTYPNDYATISSAGSIIKWDAVPGTNRYIMKIDGLIPNKSYYFAGAAYGPSFNIIDGIWKLLPVGTTLLTIQLTGTGLLPMAVDNDPRYLKLKYGTPRHFYIQK